MILALQLISVSNEDLDVRPEDGENDKELDHSHGHHAMEDCGFLLLDMSASLQSPRPIFLPEYDLAQGCIWLHQSIWGCGSEADELFSSEVIRKASQKIGSRIDIETAAECCIRGRRGRFLSR